MRYVKPWTSKAFRLSGFMFRTVCNPRCNVDRDTFVWAWCVGVGLQYWLCGVEEHLEQVDDVVVNIVVLKMSTPCIMWMWTISADHVSSVPKLYIFVVAESCWLKAVDECCWWMLLINVVDECCFWLILLINVVDEWCCWMLLMNAVAECCWWMFQIDVVD